MPTVINDTQPQETAETPVVDYSFDRSRTAQKLQVEPLMSDFDMEAKIRTIDKHITEESQPELRDSDIGYELGLEKLTQRLGLSYMEEMKKGNNLKIIDRLFSSIAIRNKMSSDTFLTHVREALRTGKVNQLKTQLKALDIKK